jgi:hypothetical protein
MGTLAEFLAGCPRDEPAVRKPAPWGSLRGFPGFMIRRMYILLSRPKEAIGVFGAGDYRTPFLFFLFFTIIFSFLSNLEPMLRSVIFSIMHVPGWSLADGISSIPSMIPLLLTSTLESSIYNSLTFGINAGILILLLQLVSGNSDWRTAFSISAYCNPVYSIPGLIISYATLPLGYLYPSEIRGIVGAIYLAGVIIGIGLVFVIAGYGIAALVLTPPARTLIILCAWVVISVCIVWVVQVFIIQPLEHLIEDHISRTFFPTSYPAAGAPGNSP